MEKIKDMTPEEFNELLAEIKEKSPNLFQIISDFVDKKLTSDEVNTFLAMTRDERLDFIKDYQAR